MDALSTLEALTGSIEEAKATRNLGSSINAAVQAATQAKLTLDKLGSMSAFVVLVAPTLNGDETQSLGVTLKDLRRIGSALVASNDVAALQEATRLLSHDLGRDITGIQSTLSAGWKRLVEREFGVTGRLGRVLSQLPETKALGNKMISLYQKAASLAANLESAQKQEKELTQLQKARDEANESLKQLGTGEDVVAFLLAVANQSATVGKLTANVRTWLAERQALELFKISL
jgi:hypothetical protein